MGLSDASDRTVIIKRDISKRIDTERTLLHRFQRNSLFRPMIDEIEEEARPYNRPVIEQSKPEGSVGTGESEPDESSTIVLRYYDCYIGEIAK